MDIKNNFKKLLCYNIINNCKCLYKYKCMFAHSLDEQKKENIRSFIINMILNWNDLSNINIITNTNLFEELVLFTKECKNCLIKKCPGGYNCKFGTCISELKICYTDLMNGKCKNILIKDNNNFICECGIHLTEKKLIPYYQRLNGDICSYKSLYLLNTVNYNNKINTISILLNNDTINIIQNLINSDDKYDLKNNFNRINKIYPNHNILKNLLDNNEFIIIKNDELDDLGIDELEFNELDEFD